jgi:predicted transcriptional regulator
MEPIIITPKNEKEYALILTLMKKMRIKTTLLHQKSSPRMTTEEYRQEAIQSLEEIRSGRVVSQDEMEKRVASWLGK